MFKSARIKLTASYVLIIMTITISFSTLMFIGVDRNTRHALESQRVRIERSEEFGGRIKFIRGPMLDAETLIEIRNETLRNIITVNTLIIVISGALAYFFAGKTLKPIEEMVEKQKRFVSDAAHEIKTPLTAMKADLEVTLRDKNLTVEESKKALKSTIEEVDKLHNLTNQLLEKSKYQNSEIKHEPVDMEKLLQKVVIDLTPIAHKRKEHINLNTELAIVSGDKEELHKLFTNLVENAIKYNKEEQNINIDLTVDSKHAVITVEDFGKGIDKKDLDNIFEPFYRTDTARTNSDSEGYGLGLAISKEIAEKHNGEIKVESTINERTKFTVKLPLRGLSADGLKLQA